MGKKSKKALSKYLQVKTREFAANYHMAAYVLQGDPQQPSPQMKIVKSALLGHTDEDHLAAPTDTATDASADADPEILWLRHLLEMRSALKANAINGTSPNQPPMEPYLFRLFALVLPRRLWEEELGDALEVLHALRKSGAPGWQIRLKILSTVAWGLVNALREVMSAVTGQAREREK